MAKDFQNTNSATLQSIHAYKSQSISIYPYTKKVNQIDDWLQGLKDQIVSINKINIEAAKKAHQKWWDDFWRRSWIFIDGDSIATKVTQGYILQRFVTACCWKRSLPNKI